MEHMKRDTVHLPQSNRRIILHILKDIDSHIYLTVNEIVAWPHNSSQSYWIY